MLRITISECNDHPTYVLEGRLAGDWVQELVWVTRELRPGTKARFDIEHVHYVDLLGEKALHWLNHLGAEFLVQNAYGVDLCERLALLRLTVGESDARKKPPQRSSGEPVSVVAAKLARRRKGKRQPEASTVRAR